MATPPTAEAFAATLDPHEELDFKLDCSGILEFGEQIDTYSLTLLAEATALGLKIMSGSGRDHAKTEDGDGNANRAVLLWLEIDAAYEENAAFDGAGTSLPFELQVVTNSSPARTRERTNLVKVAQL